MTDTAQRLKELRETEKRICWEMDGPSISSADYADCMRDLALVQREITRLSEYERFGYDEPNF